MDSLNKGFELGQKRTRRLFAWLPISAGDKKAWLKSVVVVEEYRSMELHQVNGEIFYYQDWVVVEIN